MQKTAQEVKAEKVFETRGVSDGQQDRLKSLKAAAVALQIQLEDISVPPDNAAEVGRLRSLAMTSLEESIMWASKAISRFGN